MNNNFQKTITVTLVSKEKTNKKGKPFISVNDGSDWWYVGDKSLFRFFKKGETIDCLVSTDNDFKVINDVIVDGQGTRPTLDKRSEERVMGTHDQLNRIESKIQDIFDIVSEGFPKQ